MDALINIFPPSPEQITKRYLQVFDLSLRGKYTVVIHKVTNGFWAMKLEKDGQAYPVGTARGDRKIWRDLSVAITFAQINYQFACNIVVEIGDWKLERINK